MIRASELRATWRKSSRSQNGSANCVEIADLHRLRAVRDSKNATGPTLIFDVAVFGSFLEGIRDDR
ncbi:hypothetical protein [Alloactinosynnema sp. L-07]|uniref:DUF397 domain-containing protein n=1 Tax=Alloactinosynnema sp. L-07 TaxID=1653480 RepID=UPI00065EF49F|nr:DUF397 domain-containing protein [Alloactinosynnema sp. L-07]CRK61379.1 hypothetical protein [Alloactinosynnema sp. L-07]